MKGGQGGVGREGCAGSGGQAGVGREAGVGRQWWAGRGGQGGVGREGWAGKGGQGGVGRQWWAGRGGQAGVGREAGNIPNILLYSSRNINNKNNSGMFGMCQLIPEIHRTTERNTRLMCKYFPALEGVSRRTSLRVQAMHER